MKKKLGLMTAAAIVLMPHAAAASLSLDERFDGYGFVSVLVSSISTVVYTYDKHCETLSKELADDYIKGLLESDPIITASAMKSMDEEYRKMGKEAFCEGARGFTEDGRKNLRQQ